MEVNNNHQIGGIPIKQEALHSLPGIHKWKVTSNSGDELNFTLQKGTTGESLSIQSQRNPLIRFKVEVT